MREVAIRRVKGSVETEDKDLLVKRFGNNLRQLRTIFKVEPRVLLELPAALASAQETFKRTGGLHACALFDSVGNLLVLCEDVGRHNALDKVVGWDYPYSDHGHSDTMERRVSSTGGSRGEGRALGLGLAHQPRQLFG